MKITDKKFFSIKETAEITGIKPYTLRYWEKEFSMLHPIRRESGQRKYTRKDLEIIQEIKELLYSQRYSIEGARKFLRQQKKKKEEQIALRFDEDSAAVSLMKDIKKELKEMLKILNK